MFSMEKVKKEGLHFADTLQREMHLHFTLKSCLSYSKHYGIVGL